MPAEGRHVVRRYAGDAARHVLVFTGTPAPRRRSRRGREAAPDAGPVDVARIAVIGAEPLAAPDRWLAAAGEATVAAALPVLEAALHAHRIAVGDPHRGEAAPRHPLATRVGYGTGEEVADGRWTAARELAAPREPRRREAALRPQERFAALLAARDVALACELLALRARLDLDQGRGREAALQLEAALGVALAELEGWRVLDGLPERIEELRELAPAAAATAAAARAGGLDEAATAEVGRVLGRLEAALRARTAAATL
ncbi:MAG TPA: hypothetical protein VE526_08910 [Solirubrobacteraceae bacterium]|nr:hypothetical protein [Solirubrobacteraceae bacterium]